MLKLYFRPSLVAWLGFTLVGVVVSILSAREMAAGIEAIKRVSLSKPHAEDIILMARHNLFAEYARTVAQALFMLVGLVALGSEPNPRGRKVRLMDRVLSWIIILVEGILVGNSANEYWTSKMVLRRRVKSVNIT